MRLDVLEELLEWLLRELDDRLLVVIVTVLELELLDELLEPVERLDEDDEDDEELLVEIDWLLLIEVLVLVLAVLLLDSIPKMSVTG